MYQSAQRNNQICDMFIDGNNSHTKWAPTNDK